MNISGLTVNETKPGLVFLNLNQRSLLIGASHTSAVVFLTNIFIITSCEILKPTAEDCDKFMSISNYTPKKTPCVIT